jgi:hypothetical protein
MQALQQQAEGEVQIQSFRQVYWPHPGCVAQGISMRRRDNGQQFLWIGRLAIFGRYHNLLANYINTIHASNLHVIVSPPPQEAIRAPIKFNVGSLTRGLSIGQIIADGAVVEFAPTTQRNQKLIYRIPKLAVHDLAEGHPLSFEGELQAPEPPIDVALSGKFGGWRAGHGGESILSGAYDLRSLDLGAFHDIAGIVTSKGNFDGVLEHLTVQGSAVTHNFTVATSGHPVPIAGEFNATVNGLNGDVAVNALRVHYGRTTIVGAGSVAGRSGENGKTAQFQLSSSQARVQDLVWMFISDSKPPMTGPVRFRAIATVPPSNRPFIDKLRLEGDFGISDAQYPHPDTQKDIDVLSARARGKADEVEDTNEKQGNDSYDPGRVLSNVKGHVMVSNAVANLNQVVFDVPGAQAKMRGTYNLQSEQVNLRGIMHLESELSKTTTGVKSVLLKVFEPFMKKGRRHESVIAIRIGGTYEHPTYAVEPRAEK